MDCFSDATVMRGERIIASSTCEDGADSRAVESFEKRASATRRVAESAIAFGMEIADLTEWAPASRPFQRKLTDAVAVLSVLLNPGTGAFEYRSR